MRCVTWLFVAIAAVVLAAALGPACDDRSATAPTAEAVRGVWEGTVESTRLSSQFDLCLEITEVADDAFGLSLGGEVYLDSDLVGIVAGMMDERGRFTIAGSELVGIYSGMLDGETIAGTWGTTGTDIVPELRTWSADKTDRERCE
ncbi:MAG: hypothetical protein WEE64_06715 [Dehalococcoidia bacterium]